MKSDIILVSSDGQKIEKALDLTERVAAYWRLPHKMTLQLTLLTEEVMGMMRSITGEHYGDFWIEVEGGICTLHLQAETILDSATREELLNVSSTKKNEAAKGFMGYIRDLFERGGDADIVSASAALWDYEGTTMPSSFDWTFSVFKELAAPGTDYYKSSKETWDELEKSVVAHVADDVRVSIRGRKVEMIIFKNLHTGL